VFPDYARGERVADLVVHAAGLVFAVAALAVLAAAAMRLGGATAWIGLGLYGLSLVAMLGASAAYHLAPPSALKERLRRVDHAAIYLLIAGTCTPFALFAMSGPWRAGLIALVWAVALAGAALKLARPRRFERTAIVLYLALGWSFLVAFDTSAVGGDVLALVAAGGVLYTLGVMVMLLRRMPYHNALWHALVLVAAACHLAAVVTLVGADQSGT